MPSFSATVSATHPYVHREPVPLAALQSGGNQMTLSAISHYRGGAIDEVAPLAQTLKAIYLKYGVGYRLSRFSNRSE